MSTSPRRSGARTRSGSALLAALVLAAGLAACGDDGDATATDPAGTTGTPSPADTSGTPSEPAGGYASPIRAVGSAGVTDAVVVDATEGGGSPSTMAFALDTDRAVQDFVVGLGNGLPQKVTAAVADVARQTSLATPYGAIVSTGCEAPRGVAIEAGEAGFEVVPKLPKNTVQCLAPVTYVVVFAAADA